MESKPVQSKMELEKKEERVNFLGHPIGDAQERPFGYRPGMAKTSRNDLLPTTARAGLQMVSFDFSWHGPDPYVLYDAHGLLLREWAEGVVPTWQDVAKVCRDLGLA